MKDPSFPTRLTASAADDPLVRDVLSAAKAETMAAGRVARTLATFEATKLASAARGIAGGSPNGGSRWTLPVKLGASVAIVCALGIGSRGLGSFPEPPAPPSAPTAARLAEPAPIAVPTAETTGATRVDDLPAASPAIDGGATEEHASKAPAAPARAAASPRARAPEAPASTTAASSFHEELALVETARSALARGDGETCLRELDRHAERFPAGVFADEVLVMRIEALVARGEHDRARKLGNAFLSTRPDSTYASRIRSVISTTP